MEAYKKRMIEFFSSNNITNCKENIARYNELKAIGYTSDKMVEMSWYYDNN